MTGSLFGYRESSGQEVDGTTDNYIQSKTLHLINEADEPSLTHFLLAAHTTSLSATEKEACAAGLWDRIRQKKDSLKITQMMLRIFSLLSEQPTPEVVQFFLEALEKPITNDTERVIWKNQVLESALHLSHRHPQPFQADLEFFKAVQDHLTISPRKTLALLICLVTASTYKLIDKPAIEQLQHKSKGSLLVNCEVLLAYIEGYQLMGQSPELDEQVYEKRLALPWDKRKLSYFPLQSLNLKVLVDSLLQKKSAPLVFPALAFLVSASAGSVAQYLLDTGDFHKITREALSSTGKDRLRIEHFLILVLETSRRAATAIAEEGYVDNIIKRLEIKMDNGILDGEVYSFLCLLRLLARTPQIISSFMSTFQVINLIERLAANASKLHHKDSYSSLTQSICQYLKLIGNLVLFSHRWKEIAIDSIFPYISNYLHHPEFSIEALTFIKMHLYECKEDLLPRIYRALPKSFFEKTNWTKPERLEYYRIYRNLICVARNLPEIGQLVTRLINETLRLTESFTAPQASIDPIDIDLSSELLFILANIAVITQEKALHPHLISAAIDLAAISPSLTIPFIWYLTNITWNNPSIIPLLLTYNIQSILQSKKTTDPDINERINQLSTFIKKNAHHRHPQPVQ
ncbi:hypothetical protein NEHOM01_0543 [Nematocida homosporus]|uniref:uncharacterized protein n=1 Tax=Nematocida homosporus TaxID=1912981 RepID=UPI00221E746C|nr:uncharacterized protein NEHOM01_0543 [Nematocida homosporus]KAI5184992.1 hypothetical protein NEHOM01_0543 [Nematocida homosporus]